MLRSLTTILRLQKYKRICAMIYTILTNLGSDFQLSLIRLAVEHEHMSWLLAGRNDDNQRIAISRL